MYARCVIKMEGYRYFTGDYYKYYTEFCNETEIDSDANTFFSDVELLSKEFENIKSVITNWSGEGAIAMSNNTINSIITKFDTTMENINNSLIIPDKKYYYVIRNDSLVHTDFNSKWYDEINYCRELVDNYRDTELEK